ncbi:hypothetical protein CI109_101357 [Kwoniella shandongensis]|uniref:PhoD-like phosphatase metallophosphatase domain-containing protein n=1 Tax=Kwoniella shandongensis TaxID=1734106 RepID=A0AAJ8MTG5_9TREE
MLSLAVLSLAGVALASIERNFAYDSPSFRAPRLALRRDLIKRNHKRWEYYDGQLDFPYNVASGDPLWDSVILWTHPVPSTPDPRPVCLEYQVSNSNDTWSDLVTSDQVWTTSDVDYSYKVEAKGLTPKSTYFYRFVNCADKSNASPVGRFKTTPTEDDEDVDKVSFGVFSCSNYPFGFFNAYGNVARRDTIDYAVHVGDYIYEYQGDGCTSEHACYGDGRDIHAWQLVWDDHEVADNTWKAGSADSNDTIAGTYSNVSFTERKAHAVKAYFEWLPIRTVETDDALRIWRSFKFGTLADLILLDTRQYNRDLTDLYYNTDDVKAIQDEEARSLMGGRQENWFYSELKNASTRGSQWKVVGQQIVFANLATDNVDSWDGYKANRRRVLDTISENKIDNVIIISGDSHANWVSDIAYDNKTDYNPATGDGAYAVEFAGTAVSSPSSFGYNSTLNGPYPPAYYLAAAQKLVNTTGNEELQWTEGATRGYFELHLTRSEATATYYGIADVRTRHSDEEVLATFVVEDKANKLSRPVAGGKVAGGALAQRT